MEATEASRLALKGKTTMSIRIALGFAAGIAVLAVLAANAPPAPPPVPRTPEQIAERAADAAKQDAKQACNKDWHACADNAALANSANMTYLHAKTGCKIAATTKAKFGSPVWPWFAFSSFYKGAPGNEDFYIKKGIATLIEQDAQFSNVYGAMVHSTVTCEYDMTKPDDKAIVGIYSNHNELLNDPGVK